MDLEVALIGQEATEDRILSLQDWLQREQIPDTKVKRKSQTAQAGQMGVDAGTILSVILGSTAVVQLVKSIHLWIAHSRPKCILRIKGKDKEIELSLENIDDHAKIIQDISKSI